jgi:excisionase family DNA binding protein
MQEHEQLLTVAEVARTLRLSRTSVYEMADEGRLPGFQIGGRGKIFFKRREIEAALVPQTPKPKAARNG